MAPFDTSDGLQAGGEQVVAPGASARSEMTPGSVPVVGTAARELPVPPVAIVFWLLEQSLPSLSTVTRPGRLGVPMVTLLPPVTDSDVHPVGSRTHRAGARYPEAAFAATVAERVALNDCFP